MFFFENFSTQSLPSPNTFSNQVYLVKCVSSELLRACFYWCFHKLRKMHFCFHKKLLFFQQGASSLSHILKRVHFAVWAILFNLLPDFILFVIDMHQIMLISLFSTSFDHFHFHGFLEPKPMVILRPCLSLIFSHLQNYFHFGTKINFQKVKQWKTPVGNCWQWPYDSHPCLCSSCDFQRWKLKVPSSFIWSHLITLMLSTSCLIVCFTTSDHALWFAVCAVVAH